MNEKKLKCSSCGCTVMPDSTFCAKCGTALHDTGIAAVRGTTCSACGSSVEEDDKFCPACGGALAGPSEETHDGHTDVDTAPVAIDAEKDSRVKNDDELKPSHDSSPVEGEVIGVLRVVSQEDFGKEWPLNRDVMRIGKEPDADIFLRGDDYMSHAHARVLVRDGVPDVEDLGSRNGTFVQLRGRYRLNDGDRILVGETVLEYRKPPSSER